ncbi:MAG: RHS repeat-associated core domain-containing protein [Bryobacterales bacterium]|nr:RHS repeat-associated core domain-containing protein [Bryobacterales bacterium]
MRFVTMEENVWVGKKLLKTRKGTTTEVVLQDRLGSVLFRYNANTDAKKAYAYYPYGQSRGINTPDNEDGFGTYTRLDNNENHYADQRYYNAKNGRFMTPDPIEPGEVDNPLSMNLYSYVEGDPVTFSDPEGLKPCGALLDAQSGSTVRQIMTGTSELSHLAQLIWSEAGTFIGSDDKDLFDAEQLRVGTAVMNRYDIANGRLKVYDKSGKEVIHHGFGVDGTSLDEITLQTGGNNKGWGIWTNGSLKLGKRLFLEPYLDADHLQGAKVSSPGLVEGGDEVGRTCYVVLNAIRTARAVMSGARNNPTNIILTHWNKAFDTPEGTNNFKIDILRPRGNTWYGYRSVPYVRGPDSMNGRR